MHSQPHCSRIDASLAYAAGDIAAGEREEAERHVADCQICQEYVAAWSYLLEPIDPDEELLIAELAAMSRANAHAVFRTAMRVSTHAISSPEPSSPARWYELLQSASGLTYAATVAAAFLVVAVSLHFAARSEAGKTGTDDGFAALAKATRSSRSGDLRASWQDEYAPVARVRSGASFDELQIEIAERAFRAALNVRDAAAARRGLAGAYLLRRDYPKAIAELDHAHQLAPTDAGIDVDSAVARASDGDLTGALSELDQAYALDPRRADTLFNRALVYERLGETDKARADWQAYLERDDSSQWATEARQRLRSLAGAPEAR